MPSRSDPARAALLLMDFQETILERLSAEGREALLARAAAALEGARGAGLRVFHVKVGFRDGHPEISARNAMFSAAKAAGRLVLGAPGTEIHPRLAPRAEEPVIVKKRVSAFAGSDLDALLRAGAVETLVLAGVATSGVVLSTLRQAADLDYGLAVLRDACADTDAEAQACLMDRIFPRQAEVMDTGAFLAGLA